MYLKLLNENGASRRERLRGNKIAEDVTGRSSMFISSRLESRLYPGKAIHEIVVSELPNVFYPKQSNSSLPSSFRDLMSEERLLDEEGNSIPIRIPVEELPESTLWKIRRLYSSLLMLTEDACNAAAYLYTCQPLFPTYFNPESPLTPIEWLLVSGNIVLRTFPFSQSSEESVVDKENVKDEEVKMEEEKEKEGKEEMEEKEKEEEKKEEKEKEEEKKEELNEKDKMETGNVENKVESKPVEPEPKPVEPETKPIQTESKPVEPESKPVQTESKPVQTETKPLPPIESSTKPKERMDGVEEAEPIRSNEVTPLEGVKGHAVEDRRACDLCGEVGDSAVCGRMLCTSTGEWVHLNCVYYSSGITIDEKESSIQKYTVVKNRSRSVQCYVCKRSGASIKCGASGCSRCFHFACGRSSGCLIRVNKEAFCQYHRPSSLACGVGVEKSFNPFSPRGVSSGGRSVGLSEAQMAVSASELFTTRFNHRVVFLPQRCAFRSGVRRSRSLERGLIRMGSLTVSHVGSGGVSPRMHTERFVFPDQYRAFRAFWSAKRPGTRTLYCLEIHAEAEDEDPARRPVFSISDVQSEVRFCSEDIESGRDGEVRRRRVSAAARGAATKRTLRSAATARAKGGEGRRGGMEGRMEGRKEGRIEDRIEDRIDDRIEDRIEDRIDDRIEGRKEGRKEGRIEGRIDDRKERRWSGNGREKGENRGIGERREVDGRRCDGGGNGELGVCERGARRRRRGGRIAGGAHMARFGAGRILAVRSEHSAGGGSDRVAGGESVPRVSAAGLSVVPVPPGAAARGAGDSRAGGARSGCRRG